MANASVDLDGLGCYHAIHGLHGAWDPTLIYTTALPRFLDLFRRAGVRATFFVITSDLDRTEAVRALRQAVDEGHELASHTHTHPYNLRALSDARILDELTRAEDALVRTTGVHPAGFRTPGYNVDTRILRLLTERGYLYDSSVFPCPPYYLAKAAVMGALALTGSPSRSAMTHPAALLAPLQPYRPSRWNFARPGDRKHSLPLWEIPMGVVPALRLPVIGTSLGALSPHLGQALVRAMMPGQRTLQLEFHGIDLIDHTDPGVSPALVARQPDLRRAWLRRHDTFLAAFHAVHQAGYAWKTLADLARALDEDAGPIVLR
jgi:hypothetical protein